MKKLALFLASFGICLAQSIPTTVTKYGYGDSHGQNVIANGPVIFGPSSPATVATGSSLTIAFGATFSFSGGTITGISPVVSLTGDGTASVTLTNLGNGTGALTLASVNSNVGSFGDATHVGSFTINAKGLATAASSVLITPSWANITNLPSPVLTFTGDATGTLTMTNLGSGSGALTLANTAVTPTTYGDATHVAQITFDSKGRATAASSVLITPVPLGALLAANNLSDVANAGTSLTNIGGVPTTRTVAGHALSGNVTIAASDLTNGVSGSGSIVLATSPSLTTPSLGVASATSINGNTIVQGTGTFAAPVSTISALKALNVSNYSTGNLVYVSGYHSVGDGGGGQFSYDSSSAASDNGGTIIAPGSGSGRWLRASAPALDVRWFGAVGDGSTVSGNVTAINAALATGQPVLVPTGIFLIDTPLIVQSSQRFFGSSRNGSVIKSTAAITMIESATVATPGTTANVHIDHLTFNANNIATLAMELGDDSSNLNFRWSLDECDFLNCLNGYWCNTSVQASITNCFFQGTSGLNTFGIKFANNTQECLMTNVVIDDFAIDLDSTGPGITCNACNFFFDQNSANEINLVYIHDGYHNVFSNCIFETLGTRTINEVYIISTGSLFTEGNVFSRCDFIGTDPNTTRISLGTGVTFTVWKTALRNCYFKQNGTQIEVMNTLAQNLQIYQCYEGIGYSNFLNTPLTLGGTQTTTLIEDFTGQSTYGSAPPTLFAPTHTPSSASDTGTTGTITWDASFVYVCTATNTWKRTAITTW